MFHQPYSNQLQDVINTTSHPQAPIYSSGNKIEYKRWTRVWDEMVLVKMLLDILPSHDGRVVGDDDDDDFPLRKGSSPGGIALPKGKSAPAQVPPRGDNTSSRRSPPYFFYVKMTYIPEDRHRSWARASRTKVTAHKSYSCPRLEEYLIA